MVILFSRFFSISMHCSPRLQNEQLLKHLPWFKNQKGFPSSAWEINYLKNTIMKKIFFIANSARKIASDFKNASVKLNKESLKIYSDGIKEVINAVDGNAELSNIIKKQLNTVSKVLQDDSKEINQDDRNLYARILEVAATFILNDAPRNIKASKSDYMELINANNIEELIEGDFNKLVKLDDGEIVIYNVA